MYRRLGGDVVGMTGLPEVVLAREAGICWASLAIVSNMAAGLVQGPVSRKEHAEKVAELSTQIGSVLRQAVISSANSDGLCACSTAVTDFVRGNGRPRRTEADEERTLVLLRPTVLQNRQVGSVVAVLEGVAGILGIKSVVFDDELIQAIYDRPGIANLLPGIKDAHVGKKGIAIALVGPQGTCNVVEAEVEKIRAALATDALHNGLHASGDSATAERELALIFSEKELVVPGSHRIGA
jgi:nucleoside diphosphate kinase